MTDDEFLKNQFGTSIGRGDVNAIDVVGAGFGRTKNGGDTTEVKAGFAEITREDEDVEAPVAAVLFSSKDTANDSYGTSTDTTGALPTAAPSTYPGAALNAWKAAENARENEIRTAYPSDTGPMGTGFTVNSITDRSASTYTLEAVSGEAATRSKTAYYQVLWRKSGTRAFRPEQQTKSSTVTKAFRVRYYRRAAITAVGVTGTAPPMTVTGTSSTTFSAGGGTFSYTITTYTGYVDYEEESIQSFAVSVTELTLTEGLVTAFSIGTKLYGVLYTQKKTTTQGDQLAPGSPARAPSTTVNTSSLRVKVLGKTAAADKQIVEVPYDPTAKVLGDPFSTDGKYLYYRDEAVAVADPALYSPATTPTATYTVSAVPLLPGAASDTTARKRYPYKMAARAPTDPIYTFNEIALQAQNKDLYTTGPVRYPEWYRTPFAVAYPLNYGTPSLALDNKRYDRRNNLLGSADFDASHPARERYYLSGDTYVQLRLDPGGSSYHAKIQCVGTPPAALRFALNKDVRSLPAVAACADMLTVLNFTGSTPTGSTSYFTVQYFLTLELPK